jgi:hypothetical protein
MPDPPMTAFIFEKSHFVADPITSYFFIDIKIIRTGYFVLFDMFSSVQLARVTVDNYPDRK